MFTLLEDCYRVLEDEGFCSIIVSNSAYGGVIVPTDLILAEYAEKLGFEVEKIEIDRYIITSSQQYEATKENKQFLRESLICLKKTVKEEEDNIPIVVDTLPMDIKDNAVYLINQSNTNDYTHNYFKYPCKFIPEIPRWAIRKYANEDNTVVFDPFSGSGTTLAESMINGYDAYGTEIDDVAKLLIKVKTTRLTAEEMEEINITVNDILSRIDVDSENVVVPHINNIDHWFPSENINQLGQMRFYIEQITNRNIKDFLMICLASIIRKCSFADDASPKPYVSSKVKKIPSEPKKEFNTIFKKYISGMERLIELDTMNNVRIVEGNALNVNIDRNVDLIITSPPYINAFDYARTMRLENLWLGYLTESELTQKKKLYVGTENIKKAEETENLEILNESDLLREYYDKVKEVDEKRALIVKRFFQDMKINLEEMYRILNTNGHYCIVIGNSTIREVKVESWKVLRDIALNIGFEVDLEFSYIIKNPYLSIPRNGRGGKISSDYILVLKKTN
jgi:DNA modification methylase